MRHSSAATFLFGGVVISFLPFLASASHEHGLSFDRIISIWLGKQDFDHVIVDPAMVALKKQGITLTNFYSLTHTSQPNYIAALAGDYFGLNHDDPVSIPYNVSTVVDLLEWRGISWGGYFEGLPSPGFMGVASENPSMGAWDYCRKHNPFVSFDSITRDGYRLQQLQSFDEFNRGFATDPKALPQVIFMSPNLLNSGHNTTLSYATNWAAGFLEPLLTDDAWQGHQTLILLTYDESEDYNKPNHITTILLGNSIPNNKRGTVDPTYYTHYSWLSTIEYNWRLPCLGRYDVGANVFAVVRDFQGTSYNNTEPPNAKEWDNSVSYNGALNSNPRQRRPYPRPNLKLIGAGEEGVLYEIQRAWKSGFGDVPYDGTGNIYDGKRPPVYGPAVEVVAGETYGINA